MRQLFRHLFTPHHTNNQRAKILHSQSIFFVVALLLIGSFSIGLVRNTSKSVLGISASISSQDLLLYTNEARQQAGLPPLQLNQELQQAAAGKAEDMFTKNYWAHVSPSGVTPWDFIRNAGYNYEYAGENLARGYTTAQSVVAAWMASPEHRANILSPHYTDVGFAVAQGTLTGEPDTVLVTEEFGSTAATTQQTVPPLVRQAAAATKQVQASAPAAPVASLTGTPKPQTMTSLTAKPLVDSQKATQAIGITLLSIFIAVIIFDMLYIERRKIIRIAGHNIDHIIFFVTIIIIAILLGQGVIY